MRARVTLMCAIAACAQPLGSTDHAITNGSADLGDPAVVALVDDAAFVGCTATIVGARAAITAAHCLGGIEPDALRVFLGASLADAGTFIDVVDARQHPAYDPGTLLHDVGMLTLGEDASVAPLALDARAIDPALVGASVRVVGFGSSDGGATDRGTKRTGTARISAVSPDEITVAPDPAQPCSGDSGGPLLFEDGSLAAVVSRGDAACADHAIYARIDVVRDDFIEPYLAQTAAGDGGCSSGGRAPPWIVLLLLWRRRR